MSQKSCCVPGCSMTVGCGTLHRFPNPRKDSELFKTWVARIGGKIMELEDEFINNYTKEVNAILSGKTLDFDESDKMKKFANDYYVKNKTRKVKK